MIKILIALIFMIPSVAFASEVILKSGQKIEGKIEEQTNKYIKIDSGVGVALTYYVDQIDTIDGQKLKVAIPAVSKPVVIPSPVVKTAIPVKNAGPIVVNLNPSVFAPVVSAFNLQGVMLIYFQAHGKWPGNGDLTEFKNTADKLPANEKLDVAKYDFDFQAQGNGALKVRYKLKTDTGWSEASFQKPALQ